MSAMPGCVDVGVVTPVPGCVGVGDRVVPMRPTQAYYTKQVSHPILVETKGRGDLV